MLPHLPIPYHTQYLGLDADHELSLLIAAGSPPTEDDWSLHEYRLQTGGASEHINKVTISTQLTQAKKPKDIPIPTFCSSFVDVFSEQTYNTLPPHRPFDHTIELKDSFIPKIAKVYPRNLHKPLCFSSYPRRTEPCDLVKIIDISTPTLFTTGILSPSSLSSSMI